MSDERQHGMGGGAVAADELRLLIERAERLEEEKKGISDDIKDVFAEATDAASACEAGPAGQADGLSPKRRTGPNRFPRCGETQEKQYGSGSW